MEDHKLQMLDVESKNKIAFEANEKEFISF
jgi:hypothetical protein